MSKEVTVYQSHVPDLYGGENINFLPGGPIDPSILTSPTPAHQKKWLDLGNGKGYPYIDGAYCVDCLNKAYGAGAWWFEHTMLREEEPDEQGNIEVVVALKLFVPGGPIRGISGMGSDKYSPRNKVDNLANTILSAETRALKRAARYLGIGLDVNDNPNEGAAIQAQQETIATLVGVVLGRGKKDAVLNIFSTTAPQAVDITSGEVKPGLLTEHQLEPIKKALMAESRAVVAK